MTGSASSPSPVSWPEPDPCGCSLEHGFCSEHGFMMRAIHGAWRSGDNAKMRAIWAESDGYGSPGFVPVQGYDWSGIRDSTPGAIERMFAVVS